MSIRGTGLSIFFNLSGESKDDLAVDRAVARLRHEHIISKEALDAVRSGGQEHAAKICDAILNLHHAGLLTNERMEALAAADGVLAKEISSLMLELNGTGPLSGETVRAIVKIVVSILLKYGLTTAEEMSAAILDLNRAKLLKEGGIGAQEISSAFENLIARGFFTKENFISFITQKTKNTEESVLVDSKIPFSSSSPLLPVQINLLRLFPNLPQRQILEVGKLIERCKEEAKDVGMNQVDTEMFIKDRLQKEMGRGEIIKQEREKKISEANQEIASEVLEAVKKSAVKVRFDVNYTVQKFNIQTKELVGSREQKSVDNVKTREDYHADYTRDFHRRSAGLLKRKREAETTSFTQASRLESEKISPVSQMQSQSHLAVLPQLPFSSSGSSSSHSAIVSEKKELEKEESMNTKREPSEKSEMTKSFGEEVVLDLEVAEGIIEKQKKGTLLTKREDQILKRILGSKKIVFMQEISSFGMSSFQRGVEKAERAQRQKACREYFQQCK